MLRELWKQVDGLHRARIAHRSLRAANIVGVVAVAGAAAPVVYGPAEIPGRPCTPCWSRQAVRVPPRLTTSPDRWAHGPAASSGPPGMATPRPAASSHRPAPAVRPLTAADLPLLARLHEQTPPAQREESGTTGLPAFGYLEDGALLAVACLGTWQEMPTIGVLTHPRARRRGLAHAVVAAAAREGLNRPVVQYRARRANTASLAVAARTGFIYYCDGLRHPPQPLNRSAANECVPVSGAYAQSFLSVLVWHWTTKWRRSAIDVSGETLDG